MNTWSRSLAGACACVCALFLVLAPGAARAASDIEAVWTFAGGSVAVTPNPDGTYTGTVIKETTLVECPHRVGEHMWTAITLQGDGQYWGNHQWLQAGTCAPVPTLGRNAFRVLTNAQGRFLRTCLSDPPSGLQPRIAPDGTATDTSTGCFDSSVISALPQTPATINDIATLPKQGKKRCLSRRRFTIHLREPKGDALVSAVVYVNGKKVKARRGKRLQAPINLRGLPKGRYTVRIVARTALGHTIRGKRKYRTCAKRRPGSGKHHV